MNINLIIIVLLVAAAVGYGFFMKKQISELKNKYKNVNDLPKIADSQQFWDAYNSDEVRKYYVTTPPLEAEPLVTGREELLDSLPFALLHVNTFEFVKGKSGSGGSTRCTDYKVYYSPKIKIFGDVELSLSGYGCDGFDSDHKIYTSYAKIESFIKPELSGNYVSDFDRYKFDTSKDYRYNYIKNGDSLYFCALIGKQSVEICKSNEFSSLIMSNDPDDIANENIILILGMIFLSLPMIGILAGLGFMIKKIIG